VESLGWTFDVIAPVPLGQKRMKERGYNQVALIAKPLSLSMNRYYQPVALKRRRETRSQVGLSAGERRANVHEAFIADPRLVRGRSVLVMDDVATTGATLSSSAEALLQAGASQVYAITVARALPHHGLNLI
jgi:ComF family protein